MAKRLVLRIEVDGPVREGRPAMLFFGRRVRSDLWSILQALRRAKADRRISGLLLDWRAGASIGWSRAASLRRALREVRDAGKPTVAYLESAGHADYLVATACETVMLAPGATLGLVGLRAEALFFKDFLELAGLDADLLAVGNYKSAGELATRREMSPYHREQLESILTDLTDQLASAIADGRGLSVEDARTNLAGGPYLAEEALERRLIDRVGHPDQAEALFEEKLGAPAPFLVQSRYRTGESLLRRLFVRRPQVAVVHLSGILGAPGRNAGASSAERAVLKRVRDSKRVKAVVLRVDSPGGDAVFSDLLWREIALTREKKPVVASMGDVAASGGYYVACGAHVIVAEGATLTGSIGVVGGKVVSERLLSMLGIRRESVSLSPRSGFYSPFEAWSPSDRERMRTYLEHFYEKLFLPRVSEGRRMSLDRARELGGGRVWTGRQGKDLGLVDALGDLGTAVDMAREKAGLLPGKFRVVPYQDRRKLSDLVPLRRHLMVEDVASFLDRAAGSDALFLMPWWLRIR